MITPFIIIGASEANAIYQADYKKIGNMGCYDLTGYLADKTNGSLYDKAEKRYKWLCVADRSQEFKD